MQQSVHIEGRPRLLQRGRRQRSPLSPARGAALLLLLIGCFAAYRLYASISGSEPAAAPTYIAAARTNLSSTVSATGTAQAAQQVTLTFDIGQGSGKIDEMLVRLGDQVVAGQALAKLDDTDLSQALRSAQANLSSAVARYSAAVAGATTAELASAKQAIASAQAQQITAQQNLVDLNAQPTASELASARQAVVTANGNLQSAKDSLTKAQSEAKTAQSDLDAARAKMNSACSIAATSTTTSSKSSVSSSSSSSGSNNSASDSNSISTSSTACSDARTEYTKVQATANATQSAAKSSSLQSAISSAQLGVTAAEAKYSETAAGATAGEIQAARNSLDAANGALKSAQAQYEELVAGPTADVTEPLRAAVEQARAEVSTAQKNLTAATITAPFDGYISQVTGEVGTQVSSSTTVFILLNPNLIRIDASVDQAYISSVRAGQTATVTFDALSGRSYTGTISAVGLTPTVQQGVVSYTVTLALDTSRLPQGTPVPAPGMTASISITTSTTENALAIPARAVRRIGRNQTVTVLTESGSEQRTITTGATNGILIEVTSGLSDGEQVLVSSGGTSQSAAQQSTGTQTGPLPGGPPIP